MMSVVLPLFRGRAGLIALAVFLAGGLSACSASGTAPLGAVIATPNSITFTCLTATATFSVSQQNYSGSFTAVSNNTSDATVAPGTQPNTFVVTSQAGAGQTTTITVTGGGSMTTSVMVTDPICVCRRHHDMWSYVAR
jgi:VCBS repeat-containing protein